MFLLVLLATMHLLIMRMIKMPLYVYGFRDVKSGVVSNVFVTSEPFEKVKQNISISLLQLSMKEPTNPFVLFAKDYDLTLVGVHPDELKDLNLDYTENCDVLLSASRNAFESRSNHTSQNEDSPKPKE